MRVVRFMLAIFIASFTAGAVEAQQGAASIRGRVVDQGQLVLPGVAVTVTHAESGTVRETVSGADGTYLISGLVPGPYRLTAVLQGFRRLTQEDLVLRVGATLTVDLTLQVGAVEESITITAQAPQVDLTSAQVGGNVSSGELTELPSSTRNFTGMVALLPGVQYNAAADGNSDTVTINGQHSSGVVFLMDGGSNSDDLRGGSAGAQARTAMEAVQEFQGGTNQFDAEYGAATAGVINAVTKQGSNAYHGSAFGYYTNAAMTAPDFFVDQQGLEKPDTEKQQYGGTIGGPIVRDKMHYFFSFERQNRNEGRSRFYPTRPDRSFSVAQQSNYYNYLWRVDHQMSTNHNYSVRFIWDHQPSTNQVLGNGTIDTLSIENDNDWSLVGTYNWVVGPRLLNVFRVSSVYEKPVRGQQLYQEKRDWTLAPPTLEYDSFIDQADNNYADFREMRVYGVDDTFSWFLPGDRSSHDLKVGAQYQYGEHYREDQRYMNGQFVFPSDAAFDPANPATYPEQLLIRVPGMVKKVTRTHSVGLFAQDKWRIGEALTLSLGLRYDLHVSPLTNNWNPFFADPSAYPVDRNNLQPRAGFAYSMDGGRAVLRGGYGLFYQKQWIDRFENYVLNTVFADSFIASFPIDEDPGPSNGRLPTHPLLVNGPVLNRALVNTLVRPGELARNTGTVWLDHPDRVLPSQHQASIGYERQLAGNLSMAVDYVHMVNLDMPLRYNLNPGIKQTTGRTAPVTRVDFMGIASQLGLSAFRNDVFIVENVGETRYDGVNMQVEKRFSNFWSARVSYAYGNGRGNTNGLPTATNDYQVLEERNLELNEGPTTGDRHHTMTLSGRIETPWVRGLTFGAIFRAMSGQPFTIVNSNVDADRNNILADPVPAGTYSGNGPNAITVENEGGRNGAYGPGFAQLDLRAGYRVRTGSARTLDLFLEIFNATNRVNFNNPTGDMRNANFLVPTSLLGGGFPRQYQIGARFGF